MTGVETVLSLCEVEVFSSTSMAVSSCSQRLPPDEVSAFRDTCYHFVPGEVAGYDNAADRKLSIQFTSPHVINFGEIRKVQLDPGSV